MSHLLSGPFEYFIVKFEVNNTVISLIRNKFNARISPVHLSREAPCALQVLSLQSESPLLGPFPSSGQALQST